MTVGLAWHYHVCFLRDDLIAKPWMHSKTLESWNKKCYRLLICYGPLPVFFFTASKLQFRHRVEGLRTHRFWLARARLVVAFGLFGSVASSFGTMWKGCERTVFGLPFFWLVFCMPWARILLLFEAFGSFA